MTAILIRTTVATLVAFAGAGVGVVVGGRAKARLPILVNGALGALLGIAVLEMIPDAQEQLHSAPLVAAGLASGYLLFWLIGKYVYPVCPACSLEQMEHRPEILGRALVLMMIALGVHSTMDGAAVVIGDEIKGHINIPVFFAISFHKFPEGMALALLLIGGGYRRLAAFFWTIGIEATTELGALIALFFVRGMSPLWLGLTFASIGGGFFYLVQNTLTNRHTTHEGCEEGHSLKSRLLAGGVAFALTGLLIFVSQQFER